jgi:uncharacterized protein YcfL
MKKLFVLVLFLFFLAWCSLPSNQPTENIEMTSIQTKTPAPFDVSKIVVEWSEISFGGYMRYKNIIDLWHWNIWIQMWWQDGFEIQLIYTENGNILKTSNPILWYDIQYTNKNIYQYCIEICTSTWCYKDKRTIDSVVGLDNCPLIKTISCTTDNTTETDCKNKTMEYLYNLTQWNETNMYFSQRLQAFEDSL